MKYVSLVCVSLLLCGCSNRANVSGKVTYEGKPAAGNIIFTSPEGGEQDNEIGRATLDASGQYKISNLIPGKKRVQVAAYRLMLPPSEATERLPPPVPNFPDNAEGNGQVVELQPGENVVDIALTKPARQNQ
jgi:hypothetical protein